MDGTYIKEANPKTQMRLGVSLAFLVLQFILAIAEGKTIVYSTWAARCAKRLEAAAAIAPTISSKNV